MNQYIVIFFLLSSVCLYGQQVQKSKSSYKELKQVSAELEEAVKTNDNSSLAKSYVKSAEFYKQDRNFSKAEEFYKKAIDEYKKLKNDAEIAVLSRELAIIQESQSKKKEALTSYKLSKSVVSEDKELEKMNNNDIKRLEITQKSEDVAEEKKLIQSNINLSLQKKNVPEIQQGYFNLGNTQLKGKDNQGAISSFGKVYDQSVSSRMNANTANANLAREANQKITDIYIQENKLDKAIETKKQIIKTPIIAQNLSTQIAEIQKLADIYERKNEGDSALQLLIQTYHMAIKNHLTLEAKSSLEKISAIYKRENKSSLAIPFYEQFLNVLPQLIEKDSQLIERTLIKETEDKIAQLIQEKELKDQLIEKKNTFNYFLIGFIVLLLGLIIFILFTLKSIKKKNIEIELQSLRREMNPHFIFNSLNSINQFISQQDEVSANSYLTKFSKLMRGVMENSKDDFIMLHKEIEVLDNYLQLEKSRFSDKFNFQLTVDDELFNMDDTPIPSMLIQPFIENAIWHGLRYVSEIGWLHVHFQRIAYEIVVTIEDNGVGIQKSIAYKTKHQAQHKGRGMNNTQERIKLLNALYQTHIRYTIEDKPNPLSGVKVQMWFPISQS